MKNASRSTQLFGSLVICASIALSTAATAGTITVDPSAPWTGYMNVFNTPQNGGGFQFGSGWGTADLQANYTGPILTLSPNTIGDPNPYWYTPSGGPGAVGNKIMDANFYVESTGPLAGQSITFTGLVLANTLTLASNTNQQGNGWTSVAFIKDFAPDFSSFNTITVPLTPGIFSITLNTVNDPLRHVQYGFETKGPDVWTSDAPLYGSVRLTAIPEPASLALFGLGSLGILCASRRRK